jgi:hypothetical protein
MASRAMTVGVASGLRRHEDQFPEVIARPEDHEGGDLAERGGPADRGMSLGDEVQRVSPVALVEDGLAPPKAPAMSLANHPPLLLRGERGQQLPVHAPVCLVGSMDDRPADSQVSWGVEALNGPISEPAWRRSRAGISSQRSACEDGGLAALQARSRQTRFPATDRAATQANW